MAPVINYFVEIASPVLAVGDGCFGKEEVADLQNRNLLLDLASFVNHRIAFFLDVDETLDRRFRGGSAASLGWKISVSARCCESFCSGSIHRRLSWEVATFLKG